MYDSIDPTRIPGDAQMAAGYVGGKWPTFSNGSLRQSCPRALLVSIAVNITEDAMVLDVERGDASPADAPAWCERQAGHGQVPTVYCNTSTWPAVIEAFQAARVQIPQWWRADYNGHAELEMGEVAHQYRSDTAQNLDYSVVVDFWPGVDAAPTFDDQEVAAWVCA